MIAGHQAGRDGFHIAFYSADLSGEENVGMLFHLQGLGEKCGRVDVSVAMDLAVAKEASVFEARNQAQDAGLFTKLQMVLEADEVVGIGAEIFLTQLHDGVRHFTGVGVFQTDGLHRAET